MIEQEAVEFLKSKGYKVTPPKEPSPIPNGCFRVECSLCNLEKPFFVEGKKEEMEEIKLDFEQRGYIVTDIQFAEDRFYFL